MSKFPLSLMRCMSCGNPNNPNIFCNKCELGWCSDECKAKYQNRHDNVCVPLYPQDKGTKEDLTKKYGLNNPFLPTINGKKFYVQPGPIEGDIPYFVIDKKRDSKLFEEWKSTVFASNGFKGGCPDNWYYVLEVERVPQFMLYHLSQHQVSQLDQLMLKGAQYAYGKQHKQ